MNEIRNILLKYRNVKHAKFCAKLIPTVNEENIIGIKTPEFKKVVLEINDESLIKEFMSDLPHKYLEENSLHGYLIGKNNNLDEVLDLLDAFLPYVDNWATCDSISPKVFKKDPKRVLSKIKQWIKSKDTYTIRFAVVSLLQFYLDDNYDPKNNELVAKIKSDEYYVNMAIAWYFSFTLIKQYDSTIKLFESKTLDKWIQNKSLQKAIESYRIDNERKEYLKTLKIKEVKNNVRA